MNSELGAYQVYQGYIARVACAYGRDLVIVHTPVEKAFKLILMCCLVAKMLGVVTEQTHAVAFLGRIQRCRMYWGWRLSTIGLRVTSRCSR